MKSFQWNKVNAVIAGATLALSALVLLQAQWLFHSKNLIEEQFNQKTSLALCMAVTELSDGPKSCIAAPESDLASMLTTPLLTTLPPQSEEETVRKAVDGSLAFYDIHLPYQIEIFDKKNTCASEDLPSCCSMGAIAGYNDHMLKITFPTRTQFILGKMGFMIGSSIFILSLIHI